MSTIGQITQSEFETIIVPMCESICRKCWSRLNLSYGRKRQHWDEFLNFALESVYLAIVRADAGIEFAKQIAGTRCRFATADFARSIFGRNGNGSLAQGSKKSPFAYAFTDLMFDLNLDFDTNTIDRIEDRSCRETKIDTDPLRGFTAREIEICRLLVEGYIQAEIGERIGLSESRVSQMIDRIRERMLEQNILDCQTHVKQIKGKKIGGKRNLKPRKTTQTVD